METFRKNLIMELKWVDILKKEEKRCVVSVKIDYGAERNWKRGKPNQNSHRISDAPI